MKYISLLFLLFALVQCKSQKNNITNNVKIVKGIVMDKSGPFPGAEIKVKGTERKTNTDWDGNFEIEVNEGEILIVSFPGIQNIEVLIDTKDFYKVNVLPYVPPKTRKMIRWEKKYAREHNGEVPEF